MPERMAPSLAGIASTAEIQRAPPPLPMDRRHVFRLRGANRADRTTVMHVVLTPEEPAFESSIAADASPLAGAIRSPTSSLPTTESIAASHRALLMLLVPHPICFGKTETMVAAAGSSMVSCLVAFAIAVFAWGVGSTGPTVFFFDRCHRTRGSPTRRFRSVTHFLLSAIVIAYLPEIHRRLGIAKTTFLGAVLHTAAGLILWSNAREPSQSLAAAIPSGAGWAVTSGAALNAIVAKWFDQYRPIAIALGDACQRRPRAVSCRWVSLIRSMDSIPPLRPSSGCMVAVGSLLFVRFLASLPKTWASHPTATRRIRRARGRSRDGPASSSFEPHVSSTVSAAFSLDSSRRSACSPSLVARLTPELFELSMPGFFSLATVCAVIGDRGRQVDRRA